MLYIRGAHNFSACDVLVKSRSQNDLPTKKMQKHVFISKHREFLHVRVQCI